jgi:outer membrane biosynthesis protein TonB
MPTLGEELRHRREQRAITLAEISEATRIGTRFLKAIETDNFSILPGGIFTRSFIRAYAKHVGMNEDEAVALYLQQVATPSAESRETSDEPATPKPTAEIVKPEKVKLEKVKPEKVKKHTPAPTTTNQTPVEQPRKYEPVAFRQSTARTSWSTIVIGGGILIFIAIIVIALFKQVNQGGGESGSQSTSSAQNNTRQTAPQQQPAAPAPTEQPATPTPEVAAGQPLVVKLEAATGDSWIKYQVDDSKPTTLVLKQGQSQDLPPAQTQVTLNYGNRMTLKLKINNRDANFPPDTPKFKSQVIISRENFQTYFQ